MWKPTANGETTHSKPNDTKIVNEPNSLSNGTVSDGSNIGNGHVITQNGQNGSQSNGHCVVEKDGHYFLNVLNNERDRLIALAVTAENHVTELSEQEEPPSEEIFGHLRSAAGKARLLATQKMQQFEGLCNNNVNQTPGEKFPTTSEDLQGFWDMLLLQVHQVDSIFAEIDLLKQNNWKTTTTKNQSSSAQGSKIVKRSNSKPASKKSPAVSLASSEASQRREAQRQKFLEMKRKSKPMESSNAVEIVLIESESSR